MFEVCCLMFVVCERNKMKSKNKVSEHFPLWRGAGGGFSTSNIHHSTFLTPITHYPLPITFVKVRNQKLEIKMNAIIGAPHSTSNIQNSTFIPFITHYPLPITYVKVRNQKLEIRMNSLLGKPHSKFSIQHSTFLRPITHYSLHITYHS